MTDTFIALLFAHSLADFVFQTNWMAQNKRNPVALVARADVALTGVVGKRIKYEGTGSNANGSPI